MPKISVNKILVGFVAVVGLVLILVFKNGLGGAGEVKKIQSGNKPVISAEKVEVVAVSPANLDGSTIPANQVIEVSFNKAVDESQEKLRLTVDPQADVNIELSADKKTVKVTPKKSYELGQGYTLSIKGGSKFEGGKELDQDVTYGFKTIPYNGV